MVSGAADLVIVGGALDGEELTIPPGQEPTVVLKPTGSASGLNRRLQSVEGTKTVLVIRVNGKDASTTASKSSLRDSIFGTNGDPLNLRSLYSDCSNGKLDFAPTPDSRVTNGVKTITIDENIAGASDSTIRSAVLEEATKQLGDLPSQFDHVILCLPPGTAEEWVAYAYANSWLSVFNDEKCTYPSYLAHEIGHNLNLGHAGRGTNNYGDTSGIMGYSYSADDGPKMCFNGAKSWQLGWYSDRHVTVKPAEVARWDGRLVGVADYDIVDKCPGSCSVIVQIEAGLKDFYLAFNRKTRGNSETGYGADQVLVTGQGNGYSISNNNASLTTGQQFEIANFMGTEDYVTVVVNSINLDADPGYADVSVYYGEAATISPAPTPAPFACTGGLFFSWEITTDKYPSENTWTLTKDGETIDEGEFFDAYTKHSDQLCLSPGTYVFTIRDRFNDGMCCDYGSGGYELALDGAVFTSGGVFRDQEVHEFEVSLLTAPPTRSPTTAAPTPGPKDLSPETTVGDNVVVPLDDAYVWSGTKEAKNYGSSTTLYLKKAASERKAVIKFDLSQQVLNPKSVAMLRLYVVEVGSDEYRDIGVSLVDTITWDEHTVTWDNFIATDVQSVANFTVEPSNLNSWVEVDVSNILNGATSPSVTLMLEILSKSSTGNKCVFNSREADSFGPELVVVAPPSLAPIADTYIWSGTKAGKKFGSYNTLYLKAQNNEGKALLKFDLSQEEIPDAFLATLRLHVAEVGADEQRDVSVTRLADTPAWDENVVTFANYIPVVEQTGATFTVIPNHADSWVEVDVTDLLASVTGTSVAFMLEIVSPTSSGSKCEFSSREDVTFAPELVLISLPSFKPIADAFVRSGGKAENNYGTSTNLQLKKGSTERKAVLKFEIGQNTFSDMDVATLRIYVSDIGTDDRRDISVSRLADTSFVDEYSVTWANLDQTAEQTGITFGVTPSELNGWIDVDVSDLVLQGNAGPTVVLMLEIASSKTTGNACYFGSREADGFEPKLLVSQGSVQ